MLSGARDRRKGFTLKGYAGNFMDDRNFLYLNFGDVYGSIYICQDSSNCTLKMGKFYCLQVILR